MWKCKNCSEENPDSSEFCQSCGTRNTAHQSSQDNDKWKAFDERKKAEQSELELKRRINQERLELEKREQENTDIFLKENGHEGYYEYKVLNIIDHSTGTVNIAEISQQLNILGRKGWHLRCAYTNELGKNSSTFGIGGVSSGTNSTIDQSILILERFIKFK